MAVGAAQVGPVRIPGAVAILDPGLRLVHAARAHVDADVRLGAENATVLDEFVGPEAVRLLAAPGELDAARPLLFRSDAIGPVVAADEVAAGPAQDRHPQVAGGLQDILAEPVLVAQRRTFLIDAAVDTASQVLDEVAIDVAVHLADAAVEVDLDGRHVSPV